MQDIKSLLQNYKVEDKFKYVTKEFQDYGYRIAATLHDIEHKALYIKLAKSEDRNMIEEAFAFAKHYTGAKNKGKIFMWKFYQMKREMKERQKELAKKIEETQEKLI
jgi:hypothetical protein